MDRVQWPVVLSTLFAILLGWYLLYTQRMVQGFRANAEVLTEVLVEVNGALTDTSDLDDPVARLRVAEEALIALQDLIRRSEASGCPLAALTSKGRRSHPVILRRPFFPAIYGLRGDEGAKRLFAEHPDQVCLVEPEGDYDVRDIDTEDDYRAIRRTPESS